MQKELAIFCKLWPKLKSPHPHKVLEELLEDISRKKHETLPAEEGCSY